MAEYTVLNGDFGATPTGLSINNNRRTFDFGDAITQLDPGEDFWFYFLSSLKKVRVTDPVPKRLERRYTYQQRTFNIDGAISAADPDGGITSITVDTTLDLNGKRVTTPRIVDFLVVGQTFAVDTTAEGISHWKITAISHNAADTDLTVACIGVASDPTAANWPSTIAIADNAACEITGSAFAEATGAPTGIINQFADNQSPTEIFKTSVDVFSGTALSTEFRGVRDEFERVMMEKMLEHKFDISSAMVTQVGQVDTTNNIGYTWGILPFAELYGDTPTEIDVSADGYDDLLSFCSTYMSRERGGPRKALVLASRTWMSYLDATKTNSFVAQSIPTNGTLTITDSRILNNEQFEGFHVKVVKTAFGTLGFVECGHLRGPFANYAVALDPTKVEYMYLGGNGRSRDTQLQTNVQDNDMDGRQDLFLSQVGLRAEIGECHTLLKAV